MSLQTRLQRIILSLEELVEDVRMVDEREELEKIINMLKEIWISEYY